MNKIHPEMAEAMAEAMREGMKYWRDKTPEQIEQEVRRRMLADSKPLRECQRGLEWKYERTKCGCPEQLIGQWHMPWCEGVKRIVFVASKDPLGDYRGIVGYGYDVSYPSFYTSWNNPEEGKNGDEK